MFKNDENDNLPPESSKVPYCHHNQAFTQSSSIRKALKVRICHPNCILALCQSKAMPKSELPQVQSSHQHQAILFQKDFQNAKLSSLILKTEGFKFRKCCQLRVMLKPRTSFKMRKDLQNHGHAAHKQAILKPGGSKVRNCVQYQITKNPQSE